MRKQQTKGREPRKVSGTKAQGIGEMCRALIARGKSNEAVLRAVLARYPDARTT